METLIDSNKFQPIKMKLGFDVIFVINNLGHSGGITLLCKEDTKVDIANYSRNHVDVVVCLEGRDEFVWTFQSSFNRELSFVEIK